MRKPKYRKHSGRDFGFVEVDGRRHRLPGVYGSPESLAAYEKFLAKPVVEPPPIDVSPERLTIEALVERYMDWAAGHYVSKWPRTEYHHLKPLMRRLLEFSRHDLAMAWGPKKLRAFREILIDANLSRRTINKSIASIKHMFRFGVSHEILPPTAWEALRSVPALGKNRSRAKELPPRQPVSWASVEATLPHLPRHIADMAMAQWHVGCRSEAIVLASREQFSEIDNSVWLWRPRSKTEYRGTSLVLAVGPKAQEHLRPYMFNEPFLFSPRMSNKNRRFREHYDSTSYHHAIKVAAEKAGVNHWTPHQLRRAKAQAIRNAYGVEAAQAIIGHENLSVTELYAAKSLALAARIALESG